MGEADKKPAEGLTGWDLLALGVFTLVFLSVVGIAFRTEQLTDPPLWMSRPVAWLSVDWFPPVELGWMEEWRWLRVVPWAAGLALLAALLVRAPGMVQGEEPPGLDGQLHDPTYVIRHNGLDTPELDHLSCVLWTTPGDHSAMLSRMEAYGLPTVAQAVRMVPLNTRPSDAQQDEAEKGRAMEGLD